MEFHRSTTILVCVGLLAISLWADMDASATTSTSTVPFGAPASSVVKNWTRAQYWTYRAQNMTRARQAAADSFWENRTWIQFEFEAKMAGIRENFSIAKANAWATCLHSVAGIGRGPKGPHNGSLMSCFGHSISNIRNGTHTNITATTNWFTSQADLARDNAKAIFTNAKASWDNALQYVKS
ncbi:MAG: hypothetical protein ACYDDF_08095 [Thermoplasmatota archaeon]